MRSPGAAPKLSRTFFGIVTWPFPEILLTSDIGSLLFTSRVKSKDLKVKQNPAACLALCPSEAFPDIGRESSDGAEAHPRVEAHCHLIGGGYGQADIAAA